MNDQDKQYLKDAAIGAGIGLVFFTCFMGALYVAMTAPLY
jgi:hypothetical protein